ncbi:hypothetical protein [Chitiniphilus shinanonensis]|uniref:hypothetical protein n=1 Tax=Chitiniphilus shinanonensis TaxID=553088 RepID=UPI00333E30A5
MRYYFGAYLFPAFIVKLFPFITSKAAFCGYLFLGYLLLSKLILERHRNYFYAIIALFIALAWSGADVYAEHLLRALKGLPSTPLLGIHSERWAYDNLGLSIEYSSILTALIWVPHQSIPVYIFILLILQRHQLPLSFLAATFSLLAIWTPYGMIGALPIFTWLLWSRRLELQSTFNLIALATFITTSVVVAIYLSSDMPTGGICISCIPHRLLRPSNFFFFLLIELGLFFLVLRRKIYKDPLCLISIAMLMALPFLYGNTSDFVMRASLGPIFLLVIKSTDALLEAPSVKRKLALAILIVILCVPTSANELNYFLGSGSSHRELPPFDPLSERASAQFAYGANYSASEFLEICGWKFLPQYFTQEKPKLLRSP